MALAHIFQVCRDIPLLNYIVLVRIQHQQDLVKLSKYRYSFEAPF